MSRRGTAALYRGAFPGCFPGGTEALAGHSRERSAYNCCSVRTYSPKVSEIREWHEVDADGAVLGRLASEVARVLRGKHKATFTPHLDTGDYVIVVNAAKVVLTAGKADKKFHYRYSGYPGGMRARSYGDLLAKRPEEVVRIAVRACCRKARSGGRCCVSSNLLGA